MELLEANRGAIVKFAYYLEGEKGEGYQYATFHIADRYLWSAASLSDLYEKTRASFLIRPGTDGFDRKAEEAWGSWHLVSVAEAGEGQEFFLIEEASAADAARTRHNQ
jgi:hypothetical protein